MANRLKGQTALVTGGNTGIGAAISEALVAEGANIAVNYFDYPEKAEKLVAFARKNGSEAIAVKADVSREAEVQQLFHDVVARFGTVDILFSNAGVEKEFQLVDMSLDSWQKILDVNLTGAFLCSREAARIFLERGVVADRSVAAGKIIFTSSVHEVIPWSKNSNYCASKGGLRLFMKSIAQELAPYKIRVNSIGPGAIKTNINRPMWDDPENREKMLLVIPQGRWGTPEDIARAAVWLATDEADYVNGTTLFVDGGMLLYPGFRNNG